MVNLLLLIDVGFLKYRPFGLAEKKKFYFVSFGLASFSNPRLAQSIRFILRARTSINK